MALEINTIAFAYTKIMEKNGQQSCEMSSIRLTTKVGALLGTGIGYFGGLVGGFIEHLLLNEYSNIFYHTKEALGRAWDYGANVANQFALIGACAGSAIVHFYLKKFRRYERSGV